jgi:signal transduction histidine kinase
VRGSHRDLALLVRNLVDNAIRYSHEGDKVTVDLESIGADVILSVSDTGIGIPSRDLPRVFERFYRVDRARSRETIDVESELGLGTTFRVRLPVAAP